jgi:cell division protein FtsW
MQTSKSGRALTVLTFVFVVFGLIMLSSAGVVEGQKRFGSASYYFTHQLLYGALPGAALFLLFSKINYKFWRKIALPLLIVVTGLLVLVFVPGIGYGLKGARRWVDFGFFSFQPSEFFKLALVLYLAAWFSRHEGRVSGGLHSAAPFFLVFGFAGFLLLLQPNMGTLVLVALIAVSMYFFAGAKPTHFIALVLILAVLVGAFSILEPYRFDRMKTFFISFVSPGAADVQGKAYHINQALLGIGSGGIFGLGFGQSRQKLFNYLPEPVGDSIFAIIVEELGFVGAVVLLSLFLSLTLTMVVIAKSAHNQFGRLLVFGITTWITGQALVNISSITGLVPLTGIPLPFISFGSSSLVSVMAGLGIAANVSRRS